MYLSLEKTLVIILVIAIRILLLSQEGLCPDIEQSGNSQDQVEFRGGIKNTYTNTFDVDFRRSIFPNDNYDAPIPLSGATQVINSKKIFGLEISGN